MVFVYLTVTISLLSDSWTNRNSCREARVGEMNILKVLYIPDSCFRRNDNAKTKMAIPKLEWQCKNGEVTVLKRE